MRWATRQHVLTAQAKRRSVWHRWFAWYPVVASVEDELDHRVWLEDLKRKWSVGRYRIVHIEHYAEQCGVARPVLA